MWEFNLQNKLSMMHHQLKEKFLEEYSTEKLIEVFRAILSLTLYQIETTDLNLLHKSMLTKSTCSHSPRRSNLLQLPNWSNTSPSLNICRSLKKKKRPEARRNLSPNPKHTNTNSLKTTRCRARAGPSPPARSI